MNKAIIGRKVGMTQIFAQDGTMIPVTVVEAGPCPVVQVKTVENDGYAALKLGFIETSEKALTKPELGQFKKAGVKPHKVLKEIRIANAETYTVGAELKADVFQAGDKVDVSGVTKGHGFTGVIKRWNQHRLKRRTASALCTENPVPWARTAPLRECSSRSTSPDSTVWKTSPSRTSKS